MSFRALSSGAAATNKLTHDLTAIVQAIVNHSGFTSARAPGFIITGSGTRTIES